MKWNETIRKARLCSKVILPLLQGVVRHKWSMETWHINSIQLMCAYLQHSWILFNQLHFRAKQSFFSTSPWWKLNVVIIRFPQSQQKLCAISNAFTVTWVLWIIYTKAVCPHLVSEVCSECVEEWMLCTVQNPVSCSHIPPTIYFSQVLQACALFSTVLWIFKYNFLTIKSSFVAIISQNQRGPIFCYCFIILYCYMLKTCQMRQKYALSDSE